MGTTSRPLPHLPACVDTGIDLCLLYSWSERISQCALLFCVTSSLSSTALRLITLVGRSKPWLMKLPSDSPSRGWTHYVILSPDGAGLFVWVITTKFPGHSHLSLSVYFCSCNTQDCSRLKVARVCLKLLHVTGPVSLSSSPAHGVVSQWGWCSVSKEWWLVWQVSQSLQDSLLSSLSSIHFLLMSPCS